LAKLGATDLGAVGLAFRLIGAVGGGAVPAVLMVGEPSSPASCPGGCEWASMALWVTGSVSWHHG
jgi:hypothetical protein